MSGQYIKSQAQTAGLGSRLMAIVAEGVRGRIYLAPTAEHEAIAQLAQPEWKPTQELVGKTRDQMPLYGMQTFGDLFTPRQLVALTTFSDLVGEAIEKVKADLEDRNERLGFRSQDLGFRSQDLGFRSQDLGFRSQDLGFRSQDLGFRSNTQDGNLPPISYLLNPNSLLGEERRGEERLAG